MGHRTSHYPLGKLLLETLHTSKLSILLSSRAGVGSSDIDLLIRTDRWHLSLHTLSSLLVPVLASRSAIRTRKATGHRSLRIRSRQDPLSRAHPRVSAISTAQAACTPLFSRRRTSWSRLGAAGPRGHSDDRTSLSVAGGGTEAIWSQKKLIIGPPLYGQAIFSPFSHLHFA
jgi:hypothetical protein